MREIVLDTETTGMDPAKGDRLVEIGCVEVENYVPTGRTYHVYINPERDVPAEAEAVHGLSTAFLRDKPVFAEIYTDMLDFIDGGRLVIHNAEFDVKFLNAELKRVGHGGYKLVEVVDTLKIAREKFPGSPANLDALCRRFGIDNSNRTLHGALLDAELLAEVYLELMGGRQHGLGLDPRAGGASSNDAQQPAISTSAVRNRPYREPRIFSLSDMERERHAALIAKIKDPIWNGGKN